MKKIKKKLIFLGIFSIPTIPLSILITNIIFVITGKGIVYENDYQMLFYLSSDRLGLYLPIQVVIFTLLLMVMFTSSKERTRFNDSTVKITNYLQVPAPAPKQQYGNSWWVDSKKFDKHFDYQILSKSDPIISKLLKNEKIKEDELENYILNSGIVLGSKISSEEEKIYFNGDDTHSITIGSTRSGKTRCIVLQSICLQALAGDNIVVSDPKGEILCYTKNFLENLNYKIITMDFSELEKSNRYNFLQNVIDAVNDDNIPKAVEFTNDIVKILMGKRTGEPIWSNGEASLLNFGILSTVIQNKDKPELQTLSSVYNFLSEVGTPDPEKGYVVLRKFLNALPDDDIAKLKAKVALIAPSKLRASFFTSAMSTLDFFATNHLIYEMSKKSEFNIKNVAEKRAIFIILPDQKETYYKLASLFVTMHYSAIVDSAKKLGNRLPRRVNYNLDEFGNFVEIIGMKSKLTVAGGYGIRFNLFLQSFSQLDDVYGKDIASILKDNAETLLYLKSTDIGTQKAISESLGTYTAINTTESQTTGGSYSSSTSYLERSLLKPDEVKTLERPDTLLIKGKDNAILQAPDITGYFFNKILGLGDKKHNQELIERVQNERKKIDTRNISMNLFSLFNPELLDECFGDFLELLDECFGDLKKETGQNLDLEQGE